MRRQQERTQGLFYQIRRVLLVGVAPKQVLGGDDLPHFTATPLTARLLETLRELMGRLQPDLVVCRSELLENLLGAAQARASGWKVCAGSNVHLSLLPAGEPQRAKAADERRKARSLPRSSLSDRELTILWLVFRGFRNKEIATHLGLSERTIKGHMTELFRLLDVSNRTELVASAVELGLITPTFD
jgi:DNA-binding NarL/FixJ family response regulator